MKLIQNVNGTWTQHKKGHSVEKILRSIVIEYKI